MRRGLVAMRDDAGDLRFQQRDPLVEFVVRITVKRLQGQLAGHIAFGARALIKFHRVTVCDCISLAVNRLRRYLAQRIVYQSAAQSNTRRAAADQGAWHEVGTSDNDRRGV